MLKSRILGVPLIEDVSFIYLHLIGPYYLAWKNFNWVDKRPGLGVNCEILNYALKKEKNIRILIGQKVDRVYEANPKSFIKFAETTNSIDIRNGVKIYLLPWSHKFFKTVKGDFTNILKAFESGFDE